MKEKLIAVVNAESGDKNFKAYKSATQEKQIVVMQIGSYNHQLKLINPF
jgi:hypothetical protein